MAIRSLMLLATTLAANALPIHTSEAEALSDQFKFVPYTVSVINNVDSCPELSYSPTIKLFFTTESGCSSCPSDTSCPKTKFCQMPVAKGAAPFKIVGINNGQLGIQENGEYCRVGPHRADSRCVNPDNAGMQVVAQHDVWSKPVTNCADMTLAMPFECNDAIAGNNVPDARKIVDVKSDGTFPDCTITLTRKASTSLQCKKPGVACPPY